jgi:hypothetical protein
MYNNDQNQSIMSMWGTPHITPQWSGGNNVNTGLFGVLGNLNFNSNWQSKPPVTPQWATKIIDSNPYLSPVHRG